MAFKRTLAQRLFSIAKLSRPTLTAARVSPSSSAVQTFVPPSPDKLAPDPGDDQSTSRRRFLQWRPIYQSSSGAAAPELRSLPRGEKILEKLRGMDIAKDRIRLDGLSPPPLPTGLEEDPGTSEGMLTVEDARKLLKLSQLETVKSRIGQIQKEHIPYSELVRICSEGCSSTEQALELAKMLDDSGTVIVLGNVVFLRPDQVMRVVLGLMPQSSPGSDDPRWKELEVMEKQKRIIDKKAESLVRMELWCGLGYLVVQTAAFMRLTFWTLTWDVMEPICFYVTSLYFMIGYGFFLKTSKEPSFEGFFQSRFASRQKKLMKKFKFDVEKYNELRRVYHPHSGSPERGHTFYFDPLFDNNIDRT